MEKIFIILFIIGFIITCVKEGTQAQLNGRQKQKEAINKEAEEAKRTANLRF